MQPESSDGLASVGTILPEEMAARFGRPFLFLPETAETQSKGDETQSKGDKVQSEAEQT